MHIGTLWITWTFLTCIVTRGYDNLSANKVAQQYKTSFSCLTCVATKAVDRDVQTCTRMEEIGHTSSDKSTWWHVDLAGTYNVYNIRIQFKDYGSTYTMRQRGRFAGFSLYVSNTTDRQSKDLCYKDGPELPPLDFNTNCKTNGRYVIFYNERLDGMHYPAGYETKSVLTELCEITVTGCVRLDVYGNNCDKPCRDNCPEPRCNISNGACFSCGPGWIGDICQKTCPSGYYGFKCMTKCVGHCKDNDPCNHIKGTCNNGCLDGWIGVNCDKQCSSGTYGPACLYSCTGHCLNDKACNITTGRCDIGCKPGYTGEMCDTDCSPGTYGQGCLNNCSWHCLNGATCNRTTGSCDQGCQAGYIGKLCEKASIHTDEFNDNCNASFYIAGLSFLILIIIVLVAILLLFIRRYIKLVREMRTLPYATITRTSQQPGTDTKDGHQYQELRLAEHAYNNLTLRSS